MNQRRSWFRIIWQWPNRMGCFLSRCPRKLPVKYPLRRCRNNPVRKGSRPRRRHGPRNGISNHIKLTQAQPAGFYEMALAGTDPISVKAGRNPLPPAAFYGLGTIPNDQLWPNSKSRWRSSRKSKVRLNCNDSTTMVETLSGHGDRGRCKKSQSQAQSDDPQGEAR